MSLKKRRHVRKNIPAKIVFPVNFVQMIGAGSAGKIPGINIRIDLPVLNDSQYR
jgi:hypothetical protein